ncbi:hypothetical protein V6N12_033647 [Hibiscus sabdariffa]|uniref:Uncharacterized protein n=1 Tax=Hibiscus sabdariffa TaxID=183260 RepID=A0ABR2BWG6_9ROSI
MGLVASPSQLPLLYILENHDPIRMDRKRRKVKIEEQNQINSAMDDNETPALEPLGNQNGCLGSFKILKFSSPHPSAGHLGSGLELGSPAKYLLVQSTSVLV